jgi:hypothetical protein
VSLSATETRVLSKLLERVRAVPPAGREAFIAALPEAQQGLAPRLRERLRQLEEPGVAAAPPPPPLPPLPPRAPTRHGEAVGPYRLLQPLGRGGDGPRWQADHVVAGGPRQRVALWLLPPASEDAAASPERQVVMLPPHPHITRLQDAGVDALGRAWRVLPWIEGSPLQQHAERRGLSLAERLRLFLPLCDALATVHAQGLLHGELRAAQLRVDEDGRVHLLDWGCGRPLTPAGEAAERRALALQLQSLVAGVRGGGADLAAVLRSALAELGSTPYAQLHALAADLQRVLDFRPVAVAPAGPLHRARLLLRRRRGVVAAGVLALAVAAVALATLLQQHRRGQAQDTREVQAHAYLAQVLPPDEAASDPVQTLPRLRRALEQARASFDGEPVLRGLVLTRLGSHFAEAGQPEQALAVLREALALLKGTARAGDPALHAAQAQLAAQLAAQLPAQGPPSAEARDLARQALDGCAESTPACAPVRALAQQMLQ